MRLSLKSGNTRGLRALVTLANALRESTHEFHDQTKLTPFDKDAHYREGTGSRGTFTQNQ